MKINFCSFVSFQIFCIIFHDYILMGCEGMLYYFEVLVRVGCKILDFMHWMHFNVLLNQICILRDTNYQRQPYEIYIDGIYQKDLNGVLFGSGREVL